MPDSLTPNTPVAETQLPRGWVVGRWGLIAGAMLLLVASFWVIEHDTIFANAQIRSMSEAAIRDVFIEQIERGNALRKACLLAFAAVGFVALARIKDRPWNLTWFLTLPIGLLLFWSLVSLAWSGEPALTARRLGVFACLLIGCAGLGRFLRPDEYLLTALITLAVFIAASFVVDVAMGGRPWEGGGYRFGGTLHPNAQATYCGLLCLAALVQPIGFGRRWVLRVILIAGVGLLLLTQSRTGLIALAIATVTVWTLRLSSLFRWAGLAVVLSGLAAGFIAWNCMDTGLRNRAVNTVLLGRTQQAGSLTGRVPLWEELLGDISRRPIAGYGYDAFWTPDRIAAITKSQNWSLQNAHNSYLEVVLQLGVVGLVLAVWILIAALSRTVRAYDLTRQPGYVFLFGALVFGMTNSLLESLFLRIRYTPALCLIGMLSVALFFPTQREWVEESDEEASPAPPFDLAQPADPATPAIPR